MNAVDSVKSFGNEHYKVMFIMVAFQVLTSPRPLAQMTLLNLRMGWRLRSGVQDQPKACVKINKYRKKYK